jgi:Predicted membrane protein
MSLANKTTVWVEKQIITPEQRETILSFERSNSNNTFWKTAFSIAGLLIGLGICLLIAANWQDLTNTVKLIGDFIILGAFSYFTYHFWTRENRGLTELFIILSFLMIGGSIGLIGQVFHLNGGWQSFAITWALLSLPFILISRVLFFNMVWFVLLLNGLIDSDFFETIWDTFMKYFTIKTWLALISFIALEFMFMRISKVYEKYTLLPKAAAKVSIWIAYFIVIYIGFSFGLNWTLLFGENTFMQKICSYLFVFGFFAFRMFQAMKAQNISSFKRNAILAEIYIFLIFISKINNLWTSGLGFISAGLLVLALIYILRKTTKFIKTMEVFK